MAFAAKYLANKADIIDINMGCPALKSSKNGDGSKLMLDIKSRKNNRSSSKKTSKPVTIKKEKDGITIT